MPPRRPYLLAGALAAASLLARAHGTHAAGFYLTDRGVRPLGRGGAYVAGATDQHAIWYNPAGLTEAGNGLLLDASLVLYGNTFTRTAQPDPRAPGIMFRTVEGDAAPFPIPTLVFSHDLGVRNFMLAAGVFAPNAAVTTFDSARDAPQRYSLVTLDGSLLSIVGVWAAYRPHPTFSFGAGVQALVGSFVSRLAFSACPATVTCAPEDPDWDALAQLKVGPIFSPTANAGVRWVPSPYIAFGASFQLPMHVSAPATLAVRLPSASYYEGAAVRGQDANVTFDLAPIARVGVEVRPTPQDHLEIAAVWEGWSVHDQIAVVPHGIQITNVRAVGTYDVGPTGITRGFQDTFSVRLGAEHDQDLGAGWRMTARAGAAYETSSTPPEYTSVLTMDSNKFVGTLGASFGTGHVRLDVVFAHMFASSVLVATRDARIYQTAPFRANAQAPVNPINAGSYDLSVDVIGLGMQYTF